MLENSIYSILSPEGFASILWKDSEKKREAAEIMKITANDLKDLGVIDEIIKEPKNGAHKDCIKMSDKIKKQIIKNLEELNNVSIDELLKMRFKKFREM